MVKSEKILIDIEVKDIENFLKNKEFLLDVREDYEY